MSFAEVARRCDLVQWWDATHGGDYSRQLLRDIERFRGRKRG
jgi:hypothetical protein